jgi:formylglycine-generating enzyme required for sulfatase activity
LAAVVAGAALPAAERVRAGVWLGELGDLRPRVRNLPPAMVHFHSGSFVIGLTAKEMKRLPQDKRRGFLDTLNEVPTTIADFELARYPVTNAQWALFMAADGYNPKQRCWDAPGNAWLLEYGRAEPHYWQDERFGIARANHPVVGITWYEAMASVVG